MSVVAYIGIGANLGNPIQQILDAKNSLLANSKIHRLKSSSLYISSPVGYTDQPNFVNCVYEIETELSAQQLLEFTQSIELSLGRQRDLNNQNAPRCIDLDILLYSDKCIETEALIVPHPRMKDRLFVMQPLVELAPDYLIGDSGSASKILEHGLKENRFEGQSLYRLG